MVSIAKCLLSDSEPTRTLIVKNMPYSMDAEQLKETFENCIDAHVPVFADSGKPKGYANIYSCCQLHEIVYGSIII
jgi:RNA recognition motif-containing protein